MSNTELEQVYQIQGMDCANCAQTVQQGVGKLPDVVSCSLSFTTGKMRVVGNVDPDRVIERVRALGYEVENPDTISGSTIATEGTPGFLQYMWRQMENRMVLAGALLIFPGLILHELLGWSHILIDLTSLCALILAGRPIARRAWQSVRFNKEININVLMTIASLGAVLIGAYTEAGMVMVLFAIGEALEGYTVGQARNAIRSLVSVVPNEATRLKRHGDLLGEERVPVGQLRVGDVILIKPGESIPMDGQVISGTSYVNQAPITGESRLFKKQVGSQVFASSINGQGSLEVSVTRLAADNTISRIIQMVERAQEKRAPAQRFVDRFARYYTPGVVLLAILVAILPPLIFSQPFLDPDPLTRGWLYRGLALLVVACPCALVISTPVSLISAISNAARNGVLIKGGAHLEMLSRVQAVALDKTGTLTQGRPVVVDVRALGCKERYGVCHGLDYPPESVTGENTEGFVDCNELVALASAVERRSEHPLAQAILIEAERRGVREKYPAAQQVESLAGLGVKGKLDGHELVLGSHPYFDEDVPHSHEDCQEAYEDAAEGFTPILISDNGQYVGTITVADTLRPTSREAVAMLRREGLQAVVMLTGDNADSARLVGEQISVTEWLADLMPDQKAAAVETLQAKYGRVAMAGDGINDAPALATADVGIAIGRDAGGTAQAMETADITLMGGDLRQLPFVVRLSRKTMRIVQANVALSIAIKAVFLVLVLLGMGTMWMAVLADMGTSLLVTLNGMRLLRRPRSPVAPAGDRVTQLRA